MCNKVLNLKTLDLLNFHCLTHSAMLLSYLQEPNSATRSIRVWLSSIRHWLFSRPGVRIVQKYKEDVRKGRHQKIEEKIKRLGNNHSKGEEVYVDRKYKDQATGAITTNINELLKENQVTLLQGAAGAGKSSVSVKTLKRWAALEQKNGASCFLFLAAGSEEKVPLYKLIWDEHGDVSNHTDDDLKDAFKYIQELAKAGSLCIWIDGLDELGSMTKKDTKNAGRVALHSDTLIDMKTLCVGILTQKILPGAQVVATGRNTRAVNSDILKNKAAMYELVAMDENDRGKMIDLMEQDPREKQRIRTELSRVSTSANAAFLQRPLMIKSIIELIVERKVDMNKIQNSAELYLMNLLKNMIFHTDEASSLTELDPPEYQDYLVACLQLCQQALQSESSSENLGTITGVVKNIKGSGRCFEADIFGKVQQIPFDFIKSLGIFECQTENGKAQLTIIHLSYLEFATAASLCRPGLDLQSELGKITHQERFTAVVIYLAGLLADNSGVKFLETCKDLCQNFLHLIRQNHRDGSIQEVFKSILQRNPNEGEKVFMKICAAGGLEINLTKSTISLLEETTTAAGEKVKLEYDEVNMFMEKVMDAVVKVFNIFGWNVQEGVERVDIQQVHCPTKERMMETLKNFKSWQIEHLTLGEDRATWMSKVKGERGDQLHSEEVVCWSNSALSILCTLLATCRQWSLGQLHLDYYSYAKSWSDLAAVAGKGKIDKVRVNKMDVQRGRREDVEAVKRITQEWVGR